MKGTLLRAALWLVLGGWVGSWACFGLVVAPNAFRLLPSEVAGQLVGPVLGTLHVYGLVAGVLLAPLALALGRGRLLAIAPLGMAAVCAFSHFWVTPEIATVRPFAFGPEGSVEMVTRFGELHRISLGLFMLVSAATLVLVLLHARADARDAARAGLDAR
ncbi:MAG: DUF4149 domain-containing protein [Myxococcota bacterium]